MGSVQESVIQNDSIQVSLKLICFGLWLLLGQELNGLVSRRGHLAPFINLVVTGAVIIARDDGRPQVFEIREAGNPSNWCLAKINENPG